MRPIHLKALQSLLTAVLAAALLSGCSLASDLEQRSFTIVGVEKHTSSGTIGVGRSPGTSATTSYDVTAKDADVTVEYRIEPFDLDPEPEVGASVKLWVETKDGRLEVVGREDLNPRVGDLYALGGLGIVLGAGAFFAGLILILRWTLGRRPRA